MAQLRRPFQGAGNIIRFNSHFYVVALLLLLALLILKWWLAALLMLPGVSLSLLISFYIYDLSDLYAMKWIPPLVDKDKVLVNIHAGLDETSALLRERFAQSSLQIFDFYDPSRHTELSIKKARRAYPPLPETKSIGTSNVPLGDQQADMIFLTLSAHEIRSPGERVDFFLELKRVLKNDGNIFVTEHLRDLPNFLAYNIGYLHFLPKRYWYRTFQDAGLIVAKEVKSTPFITTFIIEKKK